MEGRTGEGKRSRRGPKQVEMETEALPLSPKHRGQRRRVKKRKSETETEGPVPHRAHTGQHWAHMAEEETKGPAGPRSQPQTCPQVGTLIRKQ